MEQRQSLVLAGAALAAILSLFWAFTPRPVIVESTTVAAGKFTATVEEDGRTRVRDRYVVSAPLAGFLARITLRPGDAVSAGQILTAISPNVSPLIEERTRRELQERVGAAEASLEEAKALQERADALLVKARADLKRTNELHARGVTPTTQLDRDTAAFQAADLEMSAADRRRHAAEHTLEQARAALGRSGVGATSDRFNVTAPIEGRVLRVLQESEGAVALGAPLIELGDTGDLEVIVDLLTNEAAGVREGSRVLIERSGVGGTLEGRVRRVEPSGFTKVSALGVEEQRVWVVADIVSPRSQWSPLGDGYRVGVKIVVEELEHTLVVPIGALFRRGAEWYVFVVESGRATLRKVGLVRRSGASAAISEGLKGGESIILFPPTTLKPGTRVRSD